MSALWAALVLGLAPLPAAAACPAGTVTGEVTYVRDGDTIELGTLAIRLNGLAAPEWDAPGGQEATDAMKALVLGKSVTCELDGDRTYDRCVAICHLEGADISATLVRQGLARDCPRFSGGRYREIEQAAVDRGAMIREIYRLPGIARGNTRGAAFGLQDRAAACSLPSMRSMLFFLASLRFPEGSWATATFEAIQRVRRPSAGTRHAAPPERPGRGRWP